MVIFNSYVKLPEGIHPGVFTRHHFPRVTWDAGKPSIVAPCRPFVSIPLCFAAALQFPSQVSHPATGGRGSTRPQVCVGGVGAAGFAAAAT
jgi:hypothetical protein